LRRGRRRRCHADPPAASRGVHRSEALALAGGRGRERARVRRGADRAPPPPPPGLDHLPLRGGAEAPERGVGERDGALLLVVASQVRRLGTAAVAHRPRGAEPTRRPDDLGCAGARALPRRHRAAARASLVRSDDDRSAGPLPAARVAALRATRAPSTGGRPAVEAARPVPARALSSGRRRTGLPLRSPPVLLHLSRLGLGLLTRKLVQ